MSDYEKRVGPKLDAATYKAKLKARLERKAKEKRQSVQGVSPLGRGYRK